VALLAVALLAAAGCGSATGPSAQDPMAADGGSAAPAGPTAAPTPADRARPAECGGAPLAVGAGLADAAAGHRYLPLEVRNCTDQPVVFDQPPVVTALLPSGKRLDTPLEVVSTPGRVTLEPGALAYVGLEWLAGGREPRWADSVEVAVEGLGSGEVPLGNFDVNRDTAELRTYRWTTRPDRIWDY